MVSPDRFRSPHPEPAAADTSWFSHPGARQWRTRKVWTPARDFHESFPGYAPTPLHEVPELARELGVGRVFVKDESSRLGLPAFKMLGASWAVAQLIATRAGLRHPTLETIRQAASTDLTLVTATDGNHGRAVARMAKLIGASARVFVSAVVLQQTLDAIASEGAEIVRVDDDYDAAVRAASAHAQRQPRAQLVQDTAWEGYTQVPAWIVEGYETLFDEADEQLVAAGLAQPHLVAVPTGVGSLLQAAIAHYRSRAGSDAPAILSVEPTTAACVLTSLVAGGPTSVETDASVMAGLNCGSISTAAWPYVRDGLDAAVAVTDADALRAVDDLRSAGISSGPSGAASLAGARAVLLGDAARERRQELDIAEEPVIVLLSTEGDRLRQRERIVNH
jgi:diaminopropionate ammonia-lyase